MRLQRLFCFVLVIGTILLGTLSLPVAATPTTIAVLPFRMNTPENLQYLREGILDMLRSRLAAPGEVRVIGKAAVASEIDRDTQPVDIKKARAMASKLGADYVVIGSVTAVGSSVSLDTTVVPKDPSKDPLLVPMQSTSLDNLIPTVNLLAETINQQVLGRTSKSLQTADTQFPTDTNRNPEYLIPDSLMRGQNISYLNPNFIEVTPEEAMRQAGLWRSQTFKEAILSIDTADLDGDGMEELAALSVDRVAVYRRVAQGLQLAAEFKAGNLEDFKAVSIANVDDNERPEILVTCLSKKNKPLNGGAEKRTEADSETRPSSYVLAFDGKSLTAIADRIPFYIHAVRLPKRSRVALAQGPGRHGELFEPAIYELRVRNGKAVQAAPVVLPAACNIYNFAVGDFNKDGSNEYAVITKDNRLLILDSAGNRLWRSRKRFGATTNYLIGKIEDLRYNQVEYYYIPSPILVMDLNKDGILEIVANRTPDYSNLLPQGFKYYEAGEIVSMSWDQLGLVENWKTREVSGMVSCIRTGDLNGDGTPELIASLVLGKDLLKLWEARSTVFSYDLNVGKRGGAETARKP